MRWRCSCCWWWPICAEGAVSFAGGTHGFLPLWDADTSGVPQQDQASRSARGDRTSGPFARLRRTPDFHSTLEDRQFRADAGRDMGGRRVRVSSRLRDCAVVRGVRTDRSFGLGGAPGFHITLQERQFWSLPPRRTARCRTHGQFVRSGSGRSRCLGTPTTGWFAHVLLGYWVHRQTGGCGAPAILSVVNEVVALSPRRGGGDGRTVR